jgi:hypothetical protein
MSLVRGWCGRGESNPALKLGKLTYYRYTTPAGNYLYLASHPFAKQENFLVCHCRVINLDQADGTQ